MLCLRGGARGRARPDGPPPITPRLHDSVVRVSPQGPEGCNIKPDKEAEKALCKMYEQRGYMVQPAQPKYVTIGKGRIISIAHDLFERFDLIASSPIEIVFAQVTTSATDDPSPRNLRKRKIRDFLAPPDAHILFVVARKEQDPDNKRGKRWFFTAERWVPDPKEKNGGTWARAWTDWIPLSAVRA